MRKEQVREPGARAEVRGSRDSKEAGVTGAPHRTSRTPGAGRQSGAGLGARRQTGRKASCKLTALAWYPADKGASTPYHTPSYCCPIPGEPG